MQSVPVSCTPTVVPTPAANPAALLQRLLGTHLYEMAARFPTAPDLKGLILRKTQIWVPDEIPPEGLLAFLAEKAAAMPMPVPVNLAVAVPATATTATATATATLALTPPPPPTYSVRASYTEQVSGTASFTATRESSGSVTLDEADLIRLADECETIDRFTERIQEFVSDNESFTTDNVENYEYTDEEVTDSEGHDDWDYNQRDLQAILTGFFGRHPDLHPDYEEEEEEEELPEDDDDDDDDDADDDA